MGKIGNLSRTIYKDPNAPKATKGTLTLEKMEEIYRQAEKLSSGTLYYKHGYLLNWKGVSLSSGKKPKRIHACLLFGHWCWQNAFTNPIMALEYLIWKFKSPSHESSTSDETR